MVTATQAPRENRLFFRLDRGLLYWSLGKLPQSVAGKRPSRKEKQRRRLKGVTAAGGLQESAVVNGEPSLESPALRLLSSRTALPA